VIVTLSFSGFVVAKITFPLALRFQAMTQVTLLPLPMTISPDPLLQRGVELSSLDVTYVASFSWWILVSSGLQVHPRHPFAITINIRRRRPLYSLTHRAL
jgi:hypothetical protein